MKQRCKKDDKSILTESPIELMDVESFVEKK